MANYLGKNWKRKNLLEHVGHMNQIAGIKSVTGNDGREANVRMLEVYTGTGLMFRVLPDRALDISACIYKGAAINWSSPMGESHPAYYDSHETGWLRSFPGGLLTTCGLEHVGAATEDEGRAFGIHGRISNSPAQQVSFKTYWKGDEYFLEITGQVRQASLFAENLVLNRKIFSKLGSNKITVTDRVVNEGFEPQIHMILYHCNIGFPLLDQDTKLQLNVTETKPANEASVKDISQWSSFQKPTASYKERGFWHTPESDSDGYVTARIENPKLDFDLTIGFNKNQLPSLLQWKMMGQGTYVLGIEPSNANFSEGRSAMREQGELPLLEAGETRDYTLEFEINNKR